MARQKQPKEIEPPKNFIAASIEQATKNSAKKEPSRRRGRAEKEPDAEPEPEVKAVEKVKKEKEVKSAATGRPMAKAVGNLFLVVVLLSLLAIPVLVYFTDTGARAKRELRKVVMAMGAGSAELEKELRAARERVERLSGEVEMLQAANSALADRERSASAALTKMEAEGAKAKAGGGAGTAASEPVAQPLPPVPAVLPRQEYEVSRLFNGLGVRTTLDLRQGASATEERARQEAYEFEIKLKVAVPKAHQSVAELAALNPQLPQMLPQLEMLLGTSRVSPLFERIYGLKHDRIKLFLTRLDKVETRHNYYDCETMLELTHPGRGGKALLVQGEMDVVADGSDGDRMPEIADYISLSTYYLPMTSYGWPKRTSKPNPLLPRLEKELKEVTDEFAIKGLAPERNQYLRNRKAELERFIADLKARSYLVAEVDPFIVLPLTSVLGQEGAPAIGDFAVVIHEGRVYPVICGDAGPSWKFGEASLMVAKTINERASPYNRPVSDLKVTYLIFPGSAEPQKGPPDLARWKARCRELLEGMGGLGEGYELYDWRDHVAERAAKREAPGLVEQARSKVAEVGKNAESAAREAAAKEKAAGEAGKKLQAAKVAPVAGADGTAAAPAAPEPDVEKLQAEAKAAAAQAEQAKVRAGVAAEAAKRAEALVAQVAAAATTIRAAVDKPYHAPKTETTDVALPALEEARLALAQIEAEVGKTRAR